MRLCEHERRAREILTKARVDSPGLCARLLTAHAAGLSKLDFILAGDRDMQPHKARLLEKLVGRRARGEPLAYILGRKEFYGLDFLVNASTLTPRPETEMLVELALEVLPAQKRVRFADLGCGSGCIGLALCHERPHWPGLLLDNSPEAARMARANRDRLGSGAAILLADIFNSPLAAASLDLVVSNPPYIAAEEKKDVMAETLAYEPHSALFSPCHGLSHLKAAIAAASVCLVSGGFILLEHGAGQRPAVAAMLAESGFVDQRMENDLAGLARCAMARKP